VTLAGTMGINDALPGDVQTLGTNTRYRVVRADPDDLRDWLREGAVCALLLQHHISHVGIMEAEYPFEVRRTDLSGTFMLACYEGEGVVLVDGVWKRIRAGQACLQPPFVLNAIRCVPEQPWKFAWIRFKESRERAPIISISSPITGSFNPLPLKHAVEGLYSESCASSGASALHHWTELIYHYVLRFAQPHQADQRLWRLWQKVETDLSRPWSLSDLAAIAHMSEEHLRRLCRREIGRSPRRQLTYLRLQRAMHLLSVTDDKVEVIAREVGFESAFTFSNTFKKWIGWRPSEHRRRLR
jgi:AraC-like DNA-binding protein